jgi:hypothetical protein
MNHFAVSDNEEKKRERNAELNRLSMVTVTKKQELYTNQHLLYLQRTYKTKPTKIQVKIDKWFPRCLFLHIQKRKYLPHASRHFAIFARQISIESHGLLQFFVGAYPLIDRVLKDHFQFTFPSQAPRMVSYFDEASRSKPGTAPTGPESHESDTNNKEIHWGCLEEIKTAHITAKNANNKDLPEAVKEAKRVKEAILASGEEGKGDSLSASSLSSVEQQMSKKIKLDAKRSVPLFMVESIVQRSEVAVPSEVTKIPCVGSQSNWLVRD